MLLFLASCWLASKSLWPSTPIIPPAWPTIPLHLCMEQAALLCKYELMKNVLSKDADAGKMKAISYLVLLKQAIRYLKFYGELLSFASFSCCTYLSFQTRYSVLWCWWILLHQPMQLFVKILKVYSGSPPGSKTGKQYHTTLKCIVRMSD